MRYADDFVIFSENRRWLENLSETVERFLRDNLKLELHPDKVFIKTIVSGVDFLGWINFPRHAVLRTKTKRRMMSRIRENSVPESLASYLGLLKYGNTFELEQELRNNYWFWENKVK
ncbi:MAG: hypothetical protein PHS62_05295 [Patescibacteria group bacterium]|nr:hypothetical protein [Patescibacteria group bacterium]